MSKEPVKIVRRSYSDEYRRNAVSLIENQGSRLLRQLVSWASTQIFCVSGVRSTASWRLRIRRLRCVSAAAGAGAGSTSQEEPPSSYRA